MGIYDISGRVVETLVNGYRTAGEHRLIWNAPDVPPGNYIVKIESGGRASQSIVTLIK